MNFCIMMYYYNPIDMDTWYSCDIVDLNNKDEYALLERKCIAN
ncbi:hypothetical protein UXU46_00410 (plasmid) [Campylobacter jejuni]